MHHLQRQIILFAIFGALLFFVLSSVAMVNYPGGTIHDRSSEGYDFWYNYFSDLGRDNSLIGLPNDTSQGLFQAALGVTGISLIAFFLALPTFFRNKGARLTAFLAMLAGLVAAFSYIGIGLHPLDANYWRHTIFVRVGFIAFLVMSFFYGWSIYQEPGYPNHYARAFAVFCAILFIQVAIMLFGPRSWSSPGALLLQASAQKIVVYAEILCMVYQGVGAWRWAAVRRQL